MVGTIVLHGSDGGVLAPIRGGTFIPGKRLDIRITAASDDDDMPPAVRAGLVGVTVSTMFSSEQVNGAAPEGSRVAYASEVAEALRAAGKDALAEELLVACEAQSPGSEHCFVVFKATEYEPAQ